jgi:hypothetical protein
LRCGFRAAADPFGIRRERQFALLDDGDFGLVEIKGIVSERDFEEFDLDFYIPVIARKQILSAMAFNGFTAINKFVHAVELVPDLHQSRAGKTIALLVCMEKIRIFVCLRVAVLLPKRQMAR